VADLTHLLVRLTSLEGGDPPYDHNFLLGSAVYHLLRERSHEASTVLHDSPHRSGYVLSEVHRVSGKSGEAWFRAGTSNGTVVRLLGGALAPGTKLAVGPALFKVTGLDMEEPIVRPGEFVTLSPILLMDKETGKSLVHDVDGYPRILEDAINAQVKHNLKTQGDVRVLNVEPQGVRRRTIKERTVLAQKARLILDGPMEELQFLVNHGIGRSPALGFGMVVLNTGRIGPGFARKEPGGA